MKYQLAIFDFDGTLADSFPFFVSVLNRLASEHGFKAIDPAAVPQLRHFSARQMMRHVALPGWKLPSVARSFTALMRQRTGNVRLFDQVPAVLSQLRAAGIRLAIVSSNSLENVCSILGAENCQLFDRLECGMSIFGKRARIRKVLRSLAIEAHAAIYVGDQITDLQAARAAKVAFGAVAWGYAPLDSLRLHAPEEAFERVVDLVRLVGDVHSM